MNNTNKIFWVILILIVLIVGVLSFYLNPAIFEKIWKKFPSSEQPKSEPQITVDQTKTVLDSKSTFFIPDSSTSTQVALGDLDKDISQFVIFGATPTSVSRDKFLDGTQGFTITYEINKNINESYNEFISFSNKNPFKVAYASVANLAAIITAESSKYRVKVMVEKVGDSTSKVLVHIQER